MAHEDLDYNPFYKALQRNHSAMYESAQSKGWLVVIPHSSSLHGISMTTGFAEMHILRPSPYFQDQYIALSRSQSFGFIIESGLLRTESGFKEPFTAKVLYEELAYSKDFKPFRILVTNRPLDSAYRPQLTESDSEIGIPVGRLLQERVSLNDHTRLLKSLPSYDRIMIALDSALVQFNNNYMVVEGYLEHTAKKLDRLCAQGVETVFTYIPAMRRLALQDTRVEDSVRLAVESYIMGWVHQKVLCAIGKMKSEEDEDLYQRCKQCAGISPESLGVSKDFCCPLPEAMVELTALDSFTTPLEKLNCLKNTLELITEGIQRHLRQGVLSHGKDLQTPNLVSDDLIPILVTIIVQAKCHRLSTNLYYVENFHWASSSKANLGYSLVTFKAAAEYLLTADIKHLIPTTVEEDTTSDNPLAAAVAAASDGRVILQVKHTSSNMDSLRRAWESLDSNRSNASTASTSPTPPASSAATSAPSSVQQLMGSDSYRRSAASDQATGRPRSVVDTAAGVSIASGPSKGGGGGEGGRASPSSRPGSAKLGLWRRNTWAEPSQSVTDNLTAAGVIPSSELHRVSRTPSRSPINSNPPLESGASKSRPPMTRPSTGDGMAYDSRQSRSRRPTVGPWVDGTTEKLS